MVDFGVRLKNLRKKNDMTQEALADQLGLTKSVISAYENGMRMPSYEVLTGITAIFKVTADYMLGIEQNNYLDLSGLSDDEAALVKNIVRMFQNDRK